MKLCTRLGAAVLVSSAAVGCGLVGNASTASAAPSRKPAYTCTGGDLASGTFTSIPSGNYSSITIKGVCNITPDAVINVTGNINVAPGAVLDAQSAPSTITVGHNVNAGPGSLLGLGCQPENTIGTAAGVPCAVEPDGQTTITIRGNVTAIHADTVFLRMVTIGGNVTLIGGGGDNPWSIKGNTISRNLTISGIRPEWLGVQFNHVNGNVTLINIAIHDEDPGGVPAVVENTVGRNLICFGLTGLDGPGVSGGFIPGEVNHVTGHAIGQCATLV